jgi:hypothetical protein
VEKASVVTGEVAVEGGEVQVKKKKERAKVRFGEDQVLEAPAAPVKSTTTEHTHDHGHGHAAHPHGHSHGQASKAGHAPTPRATVRHDRPDLYEF